MRSTIQLPPPRLRRLNIRLSQQEWDKIQKLAANTTCGSVSEYSRKVLTDKPVRTFYRNQSFDRFEEQMLNLIGAVELTSSTIIDVGQRLSPLNGHEEISRALHLLCTRMGNMTDVMLIIKAHIEKLSDQCDPK